MVVNLTSVFLYRSISYTFSNFIHVSFIPRLRNYLKWSLLQRMMQISLSCTKNGGLCYIISKNLESTWKTLYDMICKEDKCISLILILIIRYYSSIYHNTISVGYQLVEEVDFESDGWFILSFLTWQNVSGQWIKTMFQALLFISKTLRKDVLRAYLTNYS